MAKNLNDAEGSGSQVARPKEEVKAQRKIEGNQDVFLGGQRIDVFFHSHFFFLGGGLEKKKHDAFSGMVYNF